MGTARKFNKILHAELDVHAAWMPVTNTFTLGDYGVFSDGVFVKMGNIAEFGADFTPGTGRPAKLRFRSDGTRVTKFLAEAEVPAIPQVNADASIRIEFTEKNSFYIDAPVLTVETIEDVAKVGRALRETEGWRRQYSVVWSTYTAQAATIISSRSANATFELNAKADVLHFLELGQAQTGITLSGETAAGVEVVAASGVIGLRLFKLRLLTGSTKVLRTPDDPDLVEYTSEAEPEDDV